MWQLEKKLKLGPKYCIFLLKETMLKDLILLL